MPLPNPILDNRSYQQLRDELVRRIPVYTPEWTDNNPSDPGITLIELFAFLGENLLFRFNQVPEQTLLAYLRLLQIPLRPAVPASAMLSLTTADLAGPLIEQGTEARAGNQSFETLTEARVWPLTAMTIARVATDAPDQTTEPEAWAYGKQAEDALQNAGLLTGSPAYYQNQTVPVEGDGLPVDFSKTVDGMVWVAVLEGQVSDRTELLKNLEDAVINIGFVPDPAVPAMDQVSACPGAGSGPKPPAVEWQVSTGEITNGAPRFATLRMAGDTTSGLTREGVVRLRMPRSRDEFRPFAIADEGLQGAGAFPPFLDDQSAAKLLFWLRAFRLDQTRVGSVQFVTLNAAEATQSLRALPEFLGTGTAQPGQRYRLVHRPVLAGTLVLEVEENPGEWVRWNEVDGFWASTPDDRHFSVDREAGEVSFGNGIRGMAPQIGQRIRAVEYRYGGGAAGNVATKAINKLTTQESVKVNNFLRAHGGADAETIAAALERIPGELRRRDRAVTASDFAELALGAPGAQVGRTECLPRFYPPTRTPETPGVVSVVVWPREDARNPAAPLPDRNLLRTVCEWLDQRRLVTTELYVIPPTYRKVAVAVGLQVKPGYGVEAVRRWVELVLRQYLAPLPPYGPEGRGFPLGGRVHGPELQAAALQVEGVKFLEGLEVAGFDGTQWVPGTVELELYEVPELTSITVVEGPPLAPAEEIEPPPGDSPVPVPVIRQEC